MLFDLLDKLIDRCIQLAQRREKQDHDLYAELLAPALEDFEKIHKNYIDTFSTYKAMLNEKDNVLTLNHPIFNKLVEDSQSSSDLRAKVLSLREYTQDPILGRFIHRMCNYIMGQQESIKVLEEGEPLRCNAPRSKFSGGLKRIFGEIRDEDNMRFESIALLDKVRSGLQVSYQLVMDEHVRVKARLLGLKIPEQPISHVDAINISHENRILGKNRTYNP